MQCLIASFLLVILALRTWPELRMFPRWCGLLCLPIPGDLAIPIGPLCVPLLP